ncbi:ATP-binding protein [Paenibacillus sp. HB172176]|uniref:ATP-binding protein n=1 Tax=Paenibacillus sp. HB172176 TaxID=2493690 RepID=UPI00143B3011|nr:ATP-binding protein [Paenibacillus sp. HB172176]
MKTDLEAVLDSHIRCRQSGMREDLIPVIPPRISDEEIKLKKIGFEEFIEVMLIFCTKAIQSLENTPIMFMLTDHEGYILECYGDGVLTQQIHAVGIETGVQFSEEVMGTNAITISLLLNRPFQLIGEHHYQIPLQDNVCYCVPVQFRSAKNEVLTGTLNIMTSMKYHSPYALLLLSNMVEAIERELELRRKNRHQYLLNQLILQSVNSGIIVTDREGIIIEFNQVAGKMLCLDRERAIGQPITSFKEYSDYMMDSIENGTNIGNVEVALSLPSDKKIIGLLDCVPIHDDSGVIVGAYLQIRDITERHELEEQMMTYEKFSAVGKLAAGMAHEIRNPLTTIMGFIQLMREHNMQSGTDTRYLDIVQDELYELKRLVSDFVMMAKPSSPERKKVDLNQLIEETISLMSSQANLLNTMIEYESEKHSLSLSLDPGQIKQVLINLMQNAMEAMPNGGRIVVQWKCDPQRKKVKVYIRDNGYGMTEKQCRDVFTPFYTTKDEGLGLGLSISYRIIEAHNGKISLNSTVGIGTEFIVELPYIYAFS